MTHYYSLIRSILSILKGYLTLFIASKEHFMYRLGPMTLLKKVITQHLTRALILLLS
jgi:hypothetical protein